MTQIVEQLTNYTGAAATEFWVTRTFWRRSDLGNPTSTDLTNIQASLSHFWADAVALLPTDVAAVQNPTCRVIDEVSGTLVAEVSGSGGGPDTGTDATSWSNGVGARVQWQTQDILNGRHVHGSMWVGPVCEDMFTDGDLSSAAVTTLGDAYTAMQSYAVALGVVLCVYHRNKKGVFTDGSSHAVTGHGVQPFPAFLKRRRA